MVAPTKEHTHTIILLHGKESHAPEFALDLFGTPSSPGSQASNNLTLPQLFPSIKWVFPQSRLRPSLRFGDEAVSQWFDMWSVENPSELEELQKEGLEESVSQIMDAVREEAEIVPLERIVLGGISQGCATAIVALLSSGLRLGGFVGLCSWLPMRESILKNARRTDLTVEEKEMLRTPVFLGHSVDDEVVPIRNGEGLRDGLRELGMDVTWEEYEAGAEMPHWLNEPKGVDDVVSFLNGCLHL